MSTKQTKLFDLNLFTGSSESIRQEVGGLYYFLDGLAWDQVIQGSTDKNYENINISPNSVYSTEKYLPSLKYIARIVGNKEKLRDNNEWLKYLMGGSFAEIEYPGIYNSNIYTDHYTENGFLPYKLREVENLNGTEAADLIATTECFQNYSRYQAYTSNIQSELSIPNYYLIDSSKFTYRVNSRTYPLFKYNAIKRYLNQEFVNEPLNPEDHLQKKNIFVLNVKATPYDDKVTNNRRTRSTYIKTEEDLSKIYSLMPFANKIQIKENLVQANTNGKPIEDNFFKEKIIEANYEYKFLKMLKESFQDEISLTPATINFGLNIEQKTSTSETSYAAVEDTSTIPLRVMDVPTMLLYSQDNPLSQTNDIFLLDQEDLYKEQESVFSDSQGLYRHMVVEKTFDIMNRFGAVIKDRFNNGGSVSTLQHLLDSANTSKYHETVAFRVQKIGGSPTGDRRTENTIQNIWFFNRNEAITYVDTQVKYSTEYTYKIFSYVLVQGYKYQTSNLAVGRVIAQEEPTSEFGSTVYCVEFYDPITGQTTPQLFSNENLRTLAERIEALEIDIENATSELQPNITSIENQYRSTRDRLPVSTQQIFEDFFGTTSDINPIGGQKVGRPYGHINTLANGQFSPAGTLFSSNYQALLNEIELELQSGAASGATAYATSTGDGSSTTSTSASGASRRGRTAATGRMSRFSTAFAGTAAATAPSTGITTPSVSPASSYNTILRVVLSTLQGLLQNIIPLIEALETDIETLNQNIIDLDGITTQVNILASNAQVNSENKYLADFQVTIEPSVKIIEIPIEEKRMRIVDHPPNDLVATPHHLRDQSNRIAFYLKYDTFSPNIEEYPTTLSSNDAVNAEAYKQGKDFAFNSKTKEESVSPARFIEVYRLATKPSSYKDFSGNLRNVIDLKNEKGDILSDHLYTERVKENTKYYYIFRVINENQVAGQISPIFESELVNDGGYTYGSFKQLTEAELIEPPPNNPTLSFKKLINVVPNIRHLELNTDMVTFSNKSTDELGNIELGKNELGSEFWDEKFKIRLTSRKTGRKVDLNLKFEKKVSK